MFKCIYLVIIQLLFQPNLQGGRSGVCNMGTCNSSFFRFLSSCIIFQPHETWIWFSNNHIVTSIMYEANKANKTRPKKETKDASSFINVKKKTLIFINSITFSPFSYNLGPLFFLLYFILLV